FVKDPFTGSTSNGYGFFSITLPTGHYNLVCSFVGYSDIVVNLNLEENLTMDFEMETTKSMIPEVEILSGGGSGDLRNNLLSEINLSPKTLSQLPGFAGDLDVLRAIQAFPGIQNFGDGSSYYYVRGGKSDQNLLLLDEVPVYNPSHLFGFFSAFSPDAINDVQVYKGDFPSKYGGRLSSVIDIKAREGNSKRFGVSGNTGPYASAITIEGPIARNKCSFFISGRISTLNWLNGVFKNVPEFNFFFYDLNAKINYRINERNRIFFTYYSGMDRFSRIINTSYRTYGITWDNLALTFRWNHLFSNKLFSNTTANYGQYKYYLFISEKQDDYWNSIISNITLKSDFTWYLNPSNTIRSGGEVTYHFSNPGNVLLVTPDSGQGVQKVSEYRSMEYVFYISNEQKVGKKVTLRYGVRLPVWQDIGPSTLYYFNPNHQVSDTAQISPNRSYATFFSPEPRIGLTWSVNSNSTVKLSYSRNTQFIQVLSNSTSPFNSLEVWAPAGPNIKPQKADQYTLGYFRQVYKKTFTFSTELFYKQFFNNIDYRDHANLLFNPLIEGETRQGSTMSYGAEFMVRKPEGKLTGWIGYTWSRAIISTPEVNSGADYSANYDRPNEICINLSYNDKRHWHLSANWIYLSGIAITVPIGFYNINGYSVPQYGPRNNGRLPDYHRLDLSVTYHFNKPGNRFSHSLTASLYNAYGRMNPFSLSFNKTDDGSGAFPVPSNINGNYNLVPTTISVAGVIPSVNYQFKF
ncbi:MAG: TonB-dependent receptor, partial [Bacteroidota bacterium]